MAGQSESSHEIRKRHDRNTDVKESERETVSTRNVGKTHNMSGTSASCTESLSSESARREEILNDPRSALLLESVRRTLERDDLLRRERKTKVPQPKTRVPQICASVLGMVCLGWPALLLFDLVLALLPFDHVEALQYSSQETSFVGVASRLCLKIVKIARTAQTTDKEYHGVITFTCLMSLASLLYMVRVTTTTQKVLSLAERQVFENLLRELSKAHPTATRQRTGRVSSSG